MKFSIIFVVLSCSISRITCFACYKGDENGCAAGQSCLFANPSECAASCENGVTASVDLKLKKDIGIPDLPCDTIFALGSLVGVETRLCTSANACPAAYICEYTATGTKCVAKEHHVSGAMEIIDGVPKCYLAPSNAPPANPQNAKYTTCQNFLISTQTQTGSGTATLQTWMTKKIPTSTATSHKSNPDGPTGTSPSSHKPPVIESTTKSVTGSNPTTIEDLVIHGVTKDGKNAYYVTKNGKKISDGKGGFLTAYTEMIGTGTGTGTGSETTKSVTGSNPTTIEDLVIHGVTKDGKNAYYVTKNGVKIPDGKGGYVTAYTEMTGTGTGTGSETTKPNCGSLLKMNVLGIILMSFL